METLAEPKERQKWDNADYICMSHILNDMSESLFNIYQSSISAKELWDKLESKYMQEDTTSKNFLVSLFNNYKMIDNKSLIEQMHEMLVIMTSVSSKIWELLDKLSKIGSGIYSGAMIDTITNIINIWDKKRCLIQNVNQDIKSLIHTFKNTHLCNINKE